MPACPPLRMPGPVPPCPPCKRKPFPLWHPNKAGEASPHQPDSPPPVLSQGHSGPCSFVGNLEAIHPSLDATQSHNAERLLGFSLPFPNAGTLLRISQRVRQGYSRAQYPGQDEAMEDLPLSSSTAITPGGFLGGLVSHSSPPFLLTTLNLISQRLLLCKSEFSM